MSQPRVLIFSEHPPARGDVPATGLSIRHGLMAEQFAARGLEVSHACPRLLERQFENRERLREDIARLVPLLARCAEIRVGNRRQADLMLGWMLLEIRKRGDYSCSTQVSRCPHQDTRYRA